MSILNTLKVTDGGVRPKGYDPVRTRRKKLAGSLQDQINLLEATGSGEMYRRVRVSRHRDLETDELLDVRQERRVAPWWWVEDDGSVRFSLRYGSIRLKIKDGMDAVVLPTLKDLRKMLPALRDEVLSGGLDGPLADAAGNLEARFKDRKQKRG